MKCAECPAKRALEIIKDLPTVRPRNSGAVRLVVELLDRAHAVACSALAALSSLPADDATARHHLPTGEVHTVGLSAAGDVQPGTQIHPGVREVCEFCKAPDEGEWAKDREVVERATPGPWTWEMDEHNPWWPDSCVCGPLNRKPGKHETPIICDTNYEPDGTFIARSRTRWPAALDEISRLRAALADERRRTVEEAVGAVEDHARRTKYVEVERRWGVVVEDMVAAIRALLEGKDKP